MNNNIYFLSSLLLFFVLVLMYISHHGYRSTIYFNGLLQQVQL